MSVSTYLRKHDTLKFIEFWLPFLLNAVKSTIKTEIYKLCRFTKLCFPDLQIIFYTGQLKILSQILGWFFTCRIYTIKHWYIFTEVRLKDLANLYFNNFRNTAKIPDTLSNLTG